MRLAPDGKVYDVDNICKEPNENEIEAIQYLRPDGKRRCMMAVIKNKKIVKYSRKMILSMEELRTGEVAFYARFKDEKEEEENIILLNNGPGIIEKCCNLIEQKWNQRYGEKK